MSLAILFKCANRTEEDWGTTMLNTILGMLAMTPIAWGVIGWVTVNH